MFVTAEIRWFWQDDCPADLRRWFDETDPTPGGGRLRTDQYLSPTNNAEISLKKRGEKSSVEIKGLVAAHRGGLVSFAPYVEVWCKWSLESPALEMTGMISAQKVRWLRTYDASGAAIVEIPLGGNEKPLNGRVLPQQGCNVEITKIQFAADARRWWTLGFEAFGDLDSAPHNLQRAAEFLVARSFPPPNSGEFLSYPSFLARFKP